MDIVWFCSASLLVILCSGQVTGQECKDLLNDKKGYFVIDNVGAIKDTVFDCKRLFEQYPALCQVTETDRFEFEVPVGGPGGVCCKTCGEPTCLDKITKDNTFSVRDKEVSSCKEIAEKYPVLCTFERKPKARCCRSCQGVDISCVDSLRSFIVENNKIVLCQEYIDLDPCRCENDFIRQKCCASCAKYNNSCVCRDTLDGTDPAILSVTEYLDDKRFDVEVPVDNCNDMVNYYVQFCGGFGGVRGKCCVSCQGVDQTCTDSIAWRGSIRKRKNKCKKCTCKEIREAGEELMKKACKKNIKGKNSSKRIRDACCLQCKRMGF